MTNLGAVWLWVTVLAVGAKVAGVLDLDWVWVLAPLWGPVAVVAVLVAALAAALAVRAAVDAAREILGR